MDKKKMDRQIVAVYTVAGAIAAVMADRIVGYSGPLSVIIPFGLYLLTLIPFVRGKEGKERTRIIFNSFFTLFLVWATVWIFFVNM